MGKLTTHVLDTANGKPGANIAVSVYECVGDTRTKLKSDRTNDDGRCDAAILEGDEFSAGVYELVFAAGDYFREIQTLPDTAFLEDVVIRFGIDRPEEHYHVPLLISPYSYTTYRGS